MFSSWKQVGIEACSSSRYLLFTFLELSGAFALSPAICDGLS